MCSNSPTQLSSRSVLSLLFGRRIVVIADGCILPQINTISTQDDEGPAWNKFWLSMDHESDSMVSGGASHRPLTPHRSVMSPDHSKHTFERGDSVLPNESASHVGDETHSELLDAHLQEENTPFPFKFKAPSGRVHRVNVLASGGIAELVSSVTAKLGLETEAVGGEPTCEDGKLSNTGYALSYLDNEGDTVSITTDQDLADAVNQARRLHHDKVDLFVHDPTHPPIPATLEPQPAPVKVVTPPESEVKERIHMVDDQEAEEYPRAPKERSPVVTHRAQEEQLIAGVPNDLLLPGAIVTLAAVILGVFVLSRSSGR
jgi:hypothetical protein